MLVRAAVQDDPGQGRAASAALRAATQIAVTNPALCEFVWVLSRGYRRSAREIADAIRRLLATENVIADRPAVTAGLAFLEAGGDFADGLIAHEGILLGGDVFMSFDAEAVSIARAHGFSAESPQPVIP